MLSVCLCILPINFSIPEPIFIKLCMQRISYIPPMSLCVCICIPLFPLRRPEFKPGSGHVGFCDGQKWRWGRFSPRTLVVSPVNLHSICFSTIIFTITRGSHNRPRVAAVPIASQTRIKKNYKKNCIQKWN
jgi:hypothetical protein